ncbi:MAG: diguanylate cyclase [Phycisphaerales bacterium JB037]
MTIDVSQLNDTSARVLLIDDSVDVHRLLKARLRHEGLEVVCASSGPEGLEIARQDPPAVILTDLMMPGMDGFEVIRELKDDPILMHVPLIVLSGMTSPQDKVMAFDLGAADFICKPFDMTELRVRVRASVRLSNLLKMLAQRAQIDGLTGLYNRAHFDARWTEEVARNARHAHPLSLAIFDADHFKSINDTYGHPAGDTVLQGIAKVLQRECRQSDIPCRFGGEEFCLIMPDTTPGDAEMVCNRVRETLGEIEWARHPERRVTISCGLVGSTGASAVTAAEWLEKADQALYAAKQGGRNQVRLTEFDPGTPRLAKAG